MLWEGREGPGVVCDKEGPDTSAWLSKATSFWTIFRFLRKMYHSTTSPMIAKNTSPPTTAPAIAPALDFELPADADEAEEVEALVGMLVEEAVAVKSDDQEISFRWS